MSLDCVVIGHNRSDFHAWARRAKEFSSYNGLFSDIRTNSVLFEGKHIDFMQLFNHAVREGSGKDSQLDSFYGPQSGVCYLASFMMRRGLEVEMINAFHSEKDRLDSLLARSPVCVAVTTTFYVEQEPIKEVVNWIREVSPGTKVVVGGPHIFNLCADLPRVTQDYVFSLLGADFYVNDSQGESTLFTLVRSLKEGNNVSEVPNLIYRDGGSWVRTQRMPETNSLDANSVDWDAFDPELLRGSCVSIRTARSCPFACSFCNYPTQAGDHVLASLEVVETELRMLHELGVRYLRFIDDTFNVPLPRFKKILRMMIENKFEFQWMSFLRCSNTDDETFELMKDAGCVGALLGIESGSDEILRNMNKAALTSRYKYGIGKLHEKGILSYASMIVGFPGETEETVRETCDFIEAVQPTFFGPLLYYHDVRAPIAARSEEFGIQGAGYSWKHKTMDWKEAGKWVESMYRDIKGSIPLALYGFCLFAQPYLLSKGYTNEQIVEFGRRTRPVHHRSLDNESISAKDEDFQHLAGIFSG